MKQSFQGFPKDSLKFLTELSRNNNRDWFNDNKPRYLESIVEPMLDFIVAMAPRLEKISDRYVADARRNGGSMFRIYRDVRFTKDKKPYKENIGCHFRHMAGKDAHAPGFYIHIEPKEVFFGGGVWCPPNDILYKIRTSIIEKPDAWTKIVKNKTLIKRFGAIRGDSLKRPPRGFDADHLHIKDLKRKSFFILQSAEPSLIFTPKFITEIERALAAASPFMQFITTALDLPYSRKK